MRFSIFHTSFNKQEKLCCQKYSHWNRMFLKVSVLFMSCQLSNRFASIPKSLLSASVSGNLLVKSFRIFKIGENR